jgi:hypothetical protein
MMAALMNKKRPRFYVLDDHGNPVTEPDLLRWEEWFGCSENRTLKHDTVSRCQGVDGFPRLRLQLLEERAAPALGNDDPWRSAWRLL